MTPSENILDVDLNVAEDTSSLFALTAAEQVRSARELKNITPPKTMLKNL